jgi:hypothetical protein
VTGISRLTRMSTPGGPSFAISNSSSSLIGGTSKAYASSTHSYGFDADRLVDMDVDANRSVIVWRSSTVASIGKVAAGVVDPRPLRWLLGLLTPRPLRVVDPEVVDVDRAATGPAADSRAKYQRVNAGLLYGSTRVHAFW